MIISGGYNIYPREIYKHPAISEVAIIGISDKEWGGSVKAVIKLKDGSNTTPKEIMDFCKTSLAEYKRPRSVDFLDDFPRTASGKIRKKILREHYFKQGKKKA